jgi:CBS domain-containing protein
MKISDLMEDEVLFVRSTSDLEQAIQSMIRHRVNGIPVVDDEMKVVGIVTEGDLIARSEMFDKDFNPAELASLRVTELMTRNPIVIDSEADINNAIAIFAATNIKQIPVIKNSRLVGVLARKDVIKGMLK